MPSISQLPSLYSIKSEYQQPSFLQAVLESFAEGELIHANERAQQICAQLNQAGTTSKFVPAAIWHTCQLL